MPTLLAQALLLGLPRPRLPRWCLALGLPFSQLPSNPALPQCHRPPGPPVMLHCALKQVGLLRHRQLRRMQPAPGRTAAC